ncbi:MAG: hypothetical protein D6696_05890 [Acidobacteria bacterium]|nr:MAG: hypothetical protein D6696_05890 [Acidobacteriota bacterium]
MIAKRPHLPFAAALLALAAPVVTARGPAERLEIVDRAIAYHGGERYRASEVELDLCSKSGCFHLRSRVDGERFDHTVTGKIRDGERRVRITNETVEAWLNGEPVAVEPAAEQRLRDWVMARVYFPFLPYRLNDPGVYKHDLGRERWGERELHKVKVTFSPGSSTDADDEYLYWFDPESGRLEQFAYSYDGDPGGLRFRRLTHYRRIGGILFADQENYGVEGDGLRVDRITPDFAATLRHVSTIKLSNVVVRPLASPADGG